MAKLSVEAVVIIELAYHLLKLFLAFIVSLVAGVQATRNLCHFSRLSLYKLGFLVERFNQLVSSRKYLLKDLFTVCSVKLFVVFTGDITKIHFLVKFLDFLNNGIQAIFFTFDRFNTEL